MTVCETALIRIIDCAICVNKLGIMGNPLDPRPYPSRGCRRRWRKNAQIFPLFSGAMCKQGRNYGEGHRSQAISESVVAVIIGGKTPRFSRCFRSWSHDKRVKKKIFSSALTWNRLTAPGSPRMITYWKHHPRHAGDIVRLCLVSVLGLQWHCFR